MKRSPAQAADPVGVRGKGDAVDERVYFWVQADTRCYFTTSTP